MLPELYLIRHGRTITNQADITCGYSQTDLTDIGVNQATQAGEFLRSIDFKKVLVSSLRRTRQTYDALCLSSEVPVEYDDRLWEINLGKYELVSEELFAAECGIARLLADHDRQSPGGESINDMKARLRAVLTEKAEGQEGPILIVSHGMTTRVLLMMLTGGDEEQMQKVEVGNCDVWKVKEGVCQKMFAPTPRQA